MHRNSVGTARRLLSRPGLGLTEFQIKVLVRTAGIPRGKTLTYGELAAMVGHPGACRAVGTALRKNPFPIIIPCHRVIRSDGSLGNYSSGGTARKRALLLEENAITYGHRRARHAGARQPTRPPKAV
jgi:methylated-DNA-[protein]-cysteine S-methyltransferase